MDKSSKSATISQLIDMLNSVKAEYGDVEVVLSGDPEGNNFGTIGDAGACVGIENQVDGSNIMVLYPLEQFTDF